MVSSQRLVIQNSYQHFLRHLHTYLPTTCDKFCALPEKCPHATYAGKSNQHRVAVPHLFKETILTEKNCGITGVISHLQYLTNSLGCLLAHSSLVWCFAIMQQYLVLNGTTIYQLFCGCIPHKSTEKKLLFLLFGTDLGLCLSGLTDVTYQYLNTLVSGTVENSVIIAPRTLTVENIAKAQADINITVAITQFSMIVLLVILFYQIPCC